MIACSSSTRAARRAVVSCIFASVLVAWLPLSGSAGQSEDDAAALHAMGVSFAEKMASTYTVTKEESKNLQEGIRDYYAGKAKPLAEDPDKIQAFQRARIQAAVEREKKASAVFLDEQARAKGATRLEDGLIFFELAAGAGDSPGPTDQVRVTYTGTLRDGTVFDSNVDSGEPAEFPLKGLIPCWKEALVRMKPGGRARFVCPSDLAYGDIGSQPLIKGGAALQFEVELVGIARN